jgi:hypothetical protein
MCGQSDTGEVAPQAKGHFFSHSLSLQPSSQTLRAAKSDGLNLQMPTTLRKLISTHNYSGGPAGPHRPPDCVRKGHGTVETPGTGVSMQNILVGFPAWVMEVVREAKLQGDCKDRFHDTSETYYEVGGRCGCGITRVRSWPRSVRARGR